MLLGSLSFLQLPSSSSLSTVNQNMSAYIHNESAEFTTIVDSWDTTQFNLPEQVDSIVNYRTNAESILEPFQALQLDPAFSFDLALLPIYQENTLADDTSRFEVLNEEHPDVADALTLPSTSQPSIDLDLTVVKAHVPESTTARTRSNILPATNLTAPPTTLAAVPRQPKWYSPLQISLIPGNAITEKELSSVTTNLVGRAN